MGSSGGFTLPTAPSMASQTATTSTPATTSGGTTFSPYKANALGNAISSTTGATDFRQAGQDFSRGGFSGIAGGIGHSIMEELTQPLQRRWLFLELVKELKD